MAAHSYLELEFEAHVVHKSTNTHTHKLKRSLFEASLDYVVPGQPWLLSETDSRNKMEQMSWTLTGASSFLSQFVN